VTAEPPVQRPRRWQYPVGIAVIVILALLLWYLRATGE
jgi:hypothetical protein